MVKLSDRKPGRMTVLERKLSQAAPKPTHKPWGLTDEEIHNWCKKKLDYIEILYTPKDERTEDEQNELALKTTQYRDWHRYQDIMNGMIAYNPDIHTSKIFDGL